MRRILLHRRPSYTGKAGCVDTRAADSRAGVPRRRNQGLQRQARRGERPAKACLASAALWGNEWGAVAAMLFVGSSNDKTAAMNGHHPQEQKVGKLDFI
eukprot:364253-Chlamydomonas_euryale.AAC.19